jgi:cob(I)alamin adenosyltransferase
MHGSLGGELPLEQGQIQVYTGNGKGKTTAALGLALRAVGRNLKVCIIQFMKGGGPYGEHVTAERLSPYLTIIPTGREGWVNRSNPDPEDVRLANEALKLCISLMNSAEYDLIILDELNGAVSFGLISVEDVLALMKSKPPFMELVITGRNADPRIIDAADLVTEMCEIKHYYKSGVPARVGIEK